MRPIVLIISRRSGLGVGVAPEKPSPCNSCLYRCGHIDRYRESSHSPSAPTGVRHCAISSAPPNTNIAHCTSRIWTTLRSLQIRAGVSASPHVNSVPRLFRLRDRLIRLLEIVAACSARSPIESILRAWLKALPDPSRQQNPIVVDVVPSQPSVQSRRCCMMVYRVAVVVML